MAHALISTAKSMVSISSYNAQAANSTLLSTQIISYVSLLNLISVQKDNTLVIQLSTVKKSEGTVFSRKIILVCGVSLGTSCLISSVFH